MVPILHFLVPFIHRVFLMRLDQLPLVVVYLLPKALRHFLRVHLLEIARPAALSARNIKPITSAAAGKLLPLAELLLVLSTGIHSISSLGRIKNQQTRPSNAQTC